MLEMIVAAGIAVMMMSLALVALTTTTRAQRRARRLLIEQEEARSALTRIRRDLEGLFDATGDNTYFQIVHDGTNNTDSLQLICATENRGPSDYVSVTWYVPQDPGHLEGHMCVECEEFRQYGECLVRKVRVWPLTGASELQVVARNVRRVRFESDGATPPAWVKVTLSMKGEELSTSELGSAPVGELYEIRWYEETVSVPAGG